MLTQTPPMMLVSRSEPNAVNARNRPSLSPSSLSEPVGDRWPRRSARGTGSASCRGSRRGPSSFRSTAGRPGQRGGRAMPMSTFCDVQLGVALAQAAEHLREHAGVARERVAGHRGAGAAGADFGDAAGHGRGQHASRARRCRPARTARRWPTSRAPLRPAAPAAAARAGAKLSALPARPSTACSRRDHLVGALAQRRPGLGDVCDRARRRRRLCRSAR